MPVSFGINNNPLRLGFTLRIKTEGLLLSPAMLYTLSYPDKEISPGSGVTRSSTSITEDSVGFFFGYE